MILMTVVVVDADTVLRKCFVETLGQAGAHVTTADHGRLAAIGPGTTDIFDLRPLHVVRLARGSGRDVVAETADAVRAAARVGACLHHVTSWKGTTPGHDAGAEMALSAGARVYRAPWVTGSAATGELDADDPVAVAFNVLHRIAATVPSWAPAPAPELGRLEIMPADVLARMVAARSTEPATGIVDLPGRSHRTIDVFNDLARLVGAPLLSPNVDPKGFLGLLPNVRSSFQYWPPPRRMAAGMMEEMGFAPPLASALVESSPAAQAPESAPAEVPALAEYAARLYGFWSARLATGRRSVQGARSVDGEIIVVTGASSGIGRATSLQLAGEGAHVLLVARREKELEALAAEIRGAGGKADAYPADLSSEDEVAALVERILAANGHVDVLVNNAGMSILRPIGDQVDRLRDFQRTMAVNYFGPVALTLGFLPSMRARGSGHIVNVLSAVAQTPAMGFAAYGASKAALDYVGLCLDAELGGEGVSVSNVYMAIVASPMLASLDSFEGMDIITCDEAAAAVAAAVVERPATVTMIPIARAETIFRAVFPEASRVVRRTFSELASWT
jgi:NAD(P)-dependent dehydrogenase (short-subunit alcohol dehydrogenase family)